MKYYKDVYNINIISKVNGINKISWQKGDVIGSGSFGKVFLALNNNTG